MNDEDENDDGDDDVYVCVHIELIKICFEYKLQHKMYRCWARVVLPREPHIPVKKDAGALATWYMRCVSRVACP